MPEPDFAEPAAEGRDPPGSGEVRLEDPLAAAARRVLRANDTGRWTVPSPARGPHQRHWDSAFAAIGLATFDWDRAATEVEAILAARWREGMLPHVRYDSRRAAEGPERWPRAQAHVADSAVRTSGITVPPIVVAAALLVGRRQPDRGRRLAFWRRTYPRLRGFVEYLAGWRRLPGSPLVVAVHPLETAWDAPDRWDLVGLLDEVDHDVAEYLEVTPYCVHGALMDALWYRAARDLREMARELGEPAPVEEARLAELAAAFEERHWDPGLGAYVDWDCVAGRRVAGPAAGGSAVLAGGLVGTERARELAAGAGPPRQAPAGWLVADGLADAGLADEAAWVRAETLDLVRTAGLGDDSATAAITLDLLDQEASRRSSRSSPGAGRSAAGGSAAMPDNRP